MTEESIMTLCVPSPEEGNDDDDSSMIGLSDQLNQIRDILTQRAYVFPNEAVTWISGMAGIGKTRLAKKLFHDPSVKANFECRAWVTMDDEVGVVFENEKNIMEGNIKDLDESFWRLSRERKCLVVFDNVRQDFLPFNQIYKKSWESKGSRILVTSRIDASVSEMYALALKMRFLNEEESWELLRRKVFGEEEEDCPQQLVKAGKKIAEECEGLPLLIIVVAPILLSKAQKNPKAWKRVAEKPDSVLEEASLQISEVLLSNYHQLKEEEKQCFLYIAVFPRKYVVRVTTIGYLWYVEGFINSWEIDAMPHLKSLCENNLVIDHQKGNKLLLHPNDLYKACRLHCGYWYVTRREAENNKFHYTINSVDDVDEERTKSHSRLAVYKNVLFSIEEVHDFMASISTVRSLLCTGPYHQYQVPMCWELKLLRVLSALTIRFYEFPVHKVEKLICLKYLSLTCNENVPPSISKLRNLQFLIVHEHSSINEVGVVSYLPVEIWDLKELEVLQIIGRNLPDPPHPGADLPNLRHLFDVGVESCTQGVLKSLPELIKLRIQIKLSPHAAETMIMTCFDHLSCLNALRSFQSVFMNPTIPPPPGSVVMNPTISHPPPTLSFQNNMLLTSLSLSGFGYPWEKMSIIAPLPNLKTLKLKCYAFRGKQWFAWAGFEKLEYLLIEDTDLMHWRILNRSEEETSQFKHLRRLFMKDCYKLQGIPLFSTHHAVEIELVDCNPKIETYTKKMYSDHNNKCSVTTIYSWKEEERR